MSNQIARQEAPVGVGITPALDPAGFFERQAHRIWESELQPDDKALRLYTLGDAIARYSSRFEGTTAPDLWSELKRKRLKSDLTRLSEDVCLLAIAATQQPLPQAKKKGEIQ